MPEILALFLTSRLLFFLFAFIAAFLVPLDPGYIGRQFDPSMPYFAWIWANFDGRHFLDIATGGYRGTNFAYFPLYPTSIWLLGRISSIPPLYLGIIISSFSFFASMFVVYKIVKLDFKENLAGLTLFFLAFFPFAFFYHVVYADSLFLLLSTASFYFARKQNWLFSGIFGGLTVLTRIAGLALIPALLLEWYLQNKKFKARSIIAPSLTLLGLAVYMAYLKFNFGDPLLFQKSMGAWQQSFFVFPPQVIWRYFKIFLFVDKSLLVFWVAVLEFVSLFVYLALSAYVWKKVRASYGVFMVVLLSMVAFTGTLAGTPRFLVHLFPAFLGMALFLEKRGLLRKLVYILFLVLGLAFTALFTRGYFIA